MDECRYLLNWAKIFLKNKDLITRNILEISDTHDHLLIKYKDKETIVLASLDIKDIQTRLDAPHIICFLFNTKVNMTNLLKEWDIWAKHDDLTIYFINPEAKVDSKWVIKPHMHDRIVERGHLKEGIKSMAESIPFLSEKEIKTIINS